MRSYSHLSEDERDQIAVLQASGRSIGAIARALSRQWEAVYIDKPGQNRPYGVRAVDLAKNDNSALVRPMIETVARG